MKTKTSYIFILAILLFSLFTPNNTAHALPTTWFVKSTGDGLANPANCPGNGCRLRDAISAAASGDIIRFTLPINSTITTTNGDFSISKELTIQAAPSNHLTIHGNDSERIFYISGDPESITNVVIEGLTLTHGRMLEDHGGAIFNQNANVTLDNMVITQNTVINSGALGYFSVGGAIYNFNGVMTITNSQITNNTATHVGGIFSGFGSTLNMTNVTISGNQTSWVNGGTGGVFVASNSGASSTSTANFEQVQIINNISATGAGGLQIGNSANVTITNSSISGNAALSYAGMLIASNANVTISTTAISNNQALTGPGGGIYVSLDASLTMTDSSISGNSASGYGGGLYGNNNSTITLERVTISGNSASEGGGIYTNDNSTANLTNVTVAGNTVSNRGGGMVIYGTANLNNVTMAGNSAINNAGGIQTAGAATINIKNSIIADNIAPSFADCSAHLNSQGHNLIENVDISGCVISGDTSTNIIGVDPMLDSLLDNGGSTLTMGLLPGSPAIDSADNTTCASEDQRTYLRPQDGDGDDTNVCDMGALEYAPYPVVFSITRANPNPTSAASVDYSVKFSEPVSNVDMADFDIATTGVTGANIANVAGSGQDYTVTVNTGTGNGTIQLELIDDDSILSSFSGDPLGGNGAVNGSASGEVYTIDHTAPTVTSSALTSTNPTSAANVDFTVTFSENVTGVGTSDFTLTTSGVSSAAVSEISGSGSSYTVTVNTGSGSGTIRLDVLNDNSIKDTGDNSLSAGYTSGPVYTIEKTAPSVLTSVRANANPTNLSSVDFTVTFSENVTGVGTSDFTLTTTGVSSAAVSGISGSGSSYTVTVNTGSGNGTIRLDVVNDGSIENATLNSLTAGFTNGEIYTVVKSATFSDVPLDYWANNYIERLYNAGITGGCVLSPLQYCPEATVTRAQMAIFLLKGIHGSSYTPPAMGVSTGFGDVAADYWAAAWIKQLAAEGITSGCGNGNYCPETTVTRAQMAIFLLKAKHGSSYSPTAATGVFNDVPVGYWADKWIEQLAVEGVTSGCGNGNYCPEADVTRAQMAIFLVKAFGLP